MIEPLAVPAYNPGAHPALIIVEHGAAPPATDLENDCYHRGRLLTDTMISGFLRFMKASAEYNPDDTEATARAWVDQGADPASRLLLGTDAILRVRTLEQPMTPAEAALAGRAVVELIQGQAATEQRDSTMRRSAVPHLFSTLLQFREFVPLPAEFVETYAAQTR